jgi:hypothetical protein
MTIDELKSQAKYVDIHKKEEIETRMISVCKDYLSSIWSEVESAYAVERGVEIKFSKHRKILCVINQADFKLSHFEVKSVHYPYPFEYQDIASALIEAHKKWYQFTTPPR